MFHSKRKNRDFLHFLHCQATEFNLTFTVKQHTFKKGRSSIQETTRPTDRIHKFGATWIRSLFILWRISILKALYGTIQPIISTLKTKADTYHDGKKHTTKNMPSVTAFHKAAQSRWRFSKFWRSSDAIELSKENTISLGFQALSKIQTMEELVPVFSPKDIAHSRRSI